MKFDLRETARDHIIIVAHRGTPGGNIPCNTLPAYETALLQGADLSAAKGICRPAACPYTAQTCTDSGTQSALFLCLRHKRLSFSAGGMVLCNTLSLITFKG
ncbi:MAG: hypothetical protein IKC72_07290 [Clostridia bacterium]|nr:hypothetical protein [Clostridia bacterium]